MLSDKEAARRAERPYVSSEARYYNVVDEFMREHFTVFRLRLPEVDRRNVKRRQRVFYGFKWFWRLVESTPSDCRDPAGPIPSVTHMKEHRLPPGFTNTRLHSARARGGYARVLRAQSGKSG